MPVPYRELQSLVEKNVISKKHAAVVEILLRRKLINETHLGPHVSPIITEILKPHFKHGDIDLANVSHHELVLLASEIKLSGTSH